MHNKKTYVEVSGESSSIAFPELSVELIKRKRAYVEATRATLLVDDCAGCVLQLRGGTGRKSGRKM